MGDRIPLGSFVLDRRIGRGGMAEVWRGRHEDGTAVAVKVLRSSVAGDPDFCAGFRAEVRAAAALDHPSITRVYDHGFVPPETDEASAGRIGAGCPYLVMELVPGGALTRHGGALDWPELKRVLMRLLDALAHAHARGVVHRDIKPANVLVVGDLDGVKLTDFGLVHALDTTVDERLDRDFVGTPTYMAPEQLRCHWRDYGPWTDLYAVGCLAWALACGGSPFQATTVEDIVRRHLLDGPPDFLPEVDVPPEFEGWVRALLERRAERRFRRAMDAAWALAHLRASGAGSNASLLEGTTALILPRPEDVPRQDPTATGFVLTIEKEQLPAWEHDPRVPPFPDDWRRPREDQLATPAALRGAGLSLYGLRTPPLVGRSDERDRLWGALAETRRTGRARLVLLQGPAGCGKTALADWLAERAHEVGAARVVRAVHSPMPGPQDGVAAMVGRQLRCVGLAPADARARISRLLPDAAPPEVSALTELVALQTDGHLRSARFGGPTERHARVRRFLEGLARERPLVVVLDDLHYGRDTIAFVANLLLAQDEHAAPILLVATVQSEALADAPAAAAEIDALAASEGAVRIALGPLPKAWRATLVRELLGLEGALAARVEERTGGNPLFAIQLVGDWVERGLLVPGRRGFELAAGADPELDVGVDEVWLRRFDAALADRPATDTLALEIAAVMCQDVPHDEWHRSLAEAGLTPAPGLVDHLLDHALARPHPEGVGVGFSFAHGMLRASLERRAVNAGRGADLHRLCADALRDRTGRDVPARLGRHLLAAGAPQEATEPLDKAIGIALYDGEVQSAELLLTELREATAELDLDPGDRTAVRQAMLEARVLRRTGQMDRAVTVAAAAAHAVRDHGHADLLPRALLDYANCLLSAGDLRPARPLMEEALRRAEAQAQAPVLAAAWRHLAYLELCEGRLAASREASREAIEHHEAMDDPMGAANAWLMKGRATAAAGNAAEAARELEEASRRYEACGARWGIATVANTLGDLARQRGRPDDAEAHYRRAAGEYDAIGSDDRVYPEINLALLLTEGARYDEARSVARKARGTFERQGRAAMVGAACIVLLPSLAAQQRWRTFDEESARGRDLLADTGFKELDIARMAQLAGDIAASGGDAARARDAYAIALAQYGALGRADGVEAVESAVAGLAGLTPPTWGSR